MTTKKLPKNWDYSPLGKVVESKKGKIPTSFSKVEGKDFIPYIDIKFFEKHITDRYAAKNDKCTIVNEDDVLVVWDGARFGLSTIGHSGALGSTILALRSKELMPKFLYYFVNSKFKIIQSKPRGVGIPHVEPSLFWNLQIPLISYNEQKRIVEKIEKLFKQIDSSVASLQKTQEKIAHFRESVLNKIFANKSYNKAKLEDFAEINPRIIIDKLSDTDNVTFLPMSSVKETTGNYSPLMVQYAKVKKGYTKFQDNDILFAKITPCMENGKVCVVKNIKYGIGFGSTEFHVIRPSNALLPKLIFYCLVRSSFRKTAKRHMTGAVGQQRVPADYLKNVLFPVISLPEQRKIVAEIEKQFAAADKMQKAVDNALENAKKLKQAILKKAFNGELVPQDPKDEPATALLAKIKAEREASKNNLKQSKRIKK